MPIPVAAAIELSDDERACLEAWTRRTTSAQGLARRSRIVLGAAEGLSNTEIAERLHIGVTTVKTHITSLMAKTDSPNRVRLALLARPDG